MKPLASNPIKMRRSGIREVMDLALQMPDALHLVIGEPDFPTPKHIVDAACAAAQAGFTKYTATVGNLSLRQLLVEKLDRMNGIPATPAEVVVTHGGVGGLMIALTATVEAGEEVLIPDPGWATYESQVVVAGAVPVRYPLDPERGFQPVLGGLDALVSSRTKAIIINTPSNPSGAVFPAETIEQLMAFARRHDLYVLSDESYEQLVYEGAHISPARFDPDGRTISIFSFSKTYSMTGWRIGYAVAPAPIAASMAKLQEPFVLGANSVGQKAAEAALTGPQDCVAEMRESYRRRRDLVVEVLKAYDLFIYAPQGAFYIMIDVSPATDDTYTFARELLERRRVAVAPGEAFGPAGQGFVRVSLAAAQDTLLEGVNRLVAEVGARAGSRGRV